MTIAEAISMAGVLKPNVMTDNAKKRFLCQIDQLIYDEIISQHEHGESCETEFLNGIAELIDEEQLLVDVQEKADVVAFIDMLRGKFHEEILKKQAIIPEAKLLFLQGMETALQAKVTAASEYTKSELVTFIGTVEDAIGDETAEDPERPYYDNSTSTSTVLMVPSPHDMLYVYWLICQIDHMNMEMDKYNNDRELFQNAYDTFCDWYTRQHMPKQRNREFRL